jgi:hypothetical protein
MLNPQEEGRKILRHMDQALAPVVPLFTVGLPPADRALSIFNCCGDNQQFALIVVQAYELAAVRQARVDEELYWVCVRMHLEGLTGAEA